MTASIVVNDINNTIISYRNEVPIYDILPDEEHDIPVVNADYEIPVVTTDIPVTPCPAYATTTFTEAEVLPVVTVTTDCGYKDVDTSPEQAWGQIH